MGEVSHTLKPVKKVWRNQLEILQIEHSTDVFVCTCLQIACVASKFDFMSFLKRLHVCGSSRVSFAIVLFGKMSDSYELVEGMEELYFEADQVSIPGSDDSAGRTQHYVESYVYEPEDGENAPGLGPHSEVTDAEVSTAQLPVTLSGCFITTSGKCLHTAVCHRGKRAEVKTLIVKICTKCLSKT